MRRSSSEWRRMRSTRIYINDTNIGTMESRMGGKLVLSVEVSACAGSVPVKVVKL